MRLGIAAILVVLAGFSATPAQAGPHGDKMAKCLVTSTSSSERSVLIQWIFAAMAAHPDVSALSNVTSQKGEELNKKVADLFVVLLTQKCKPETEQALKNEGEQAFVASFGVLGQVAMEGITAAPAVSQYMGRLEQYVDKKAIDRAFSSGK